MKEHYRSIEAGNSPRSNKIAIKKYDEFDLEEGEEVFMSSFYLSQFGTLDQNVRLTCLSQGFVFM